MISIHVRYTHRIAGASLAVTIALVSIIATGVGYADSSRDTVIGVLVYDECIQALDSIFNVKLEPVGVISDRGYIVNVYYWQKTSPIEDVESYIVNSSVLHYPGAALLKLSHYLCSSSSRVWDFNLEVEMLAERGILNADDSVKAIAESLMKYSRWLFPCNEREVLIIGVDRDKINVILPLIKGYIDRVLSSVPGGWWKPRQIVVCGLDRNPAENLDPDVYKRMDELLRRECANLSLKLVSIECRGRRSFLLGENPLTGRPLIPVMSKYYDEVVRGNRSVVRAIGLAVADVLRKVNYPAKIVDVEVWPEGELTCRLDVGSASDFMVVEQPPIKAREKPVSEQADVEAREDSTVTHAGMGELPVTVGPGGLNEGSSSSPKTKAMRVVYSYNTGTLSWHGTASSKAAKEDNTCGKVGTILLAGSLLAAGIIVAVALPRSKASQ